MDAGTVHGRAIATRRALIICALVACVVATAFAVAGCGGKSKEEQAAARRASAQARTMTFGKQVFETNCHSCHQLYNKVHTGTTGEYGPSFDDIRVSKAQVAERVHNGGIGMQSFSELSEEQIAAVATYVSTLAGRNVAAPALSQADRTLGAQVFNSTCRSCHTLQGKQNGDAPGTNFDIIKPGIAYIHRMITRGNVFMSPQASNLTRAQIEAVAKYVNALSGSRPNRSLR